MGFFVLFLGIIFTILSGAILSYISMATMIGPWIAPAIVLASSLIFKLKHNNTDKIQQNKALSIIQTIGSVGGIIGVAIGFSLPTLYFLDQNAFNLLTQNAFSFAGMIFVLCLAAGGFGIWLARAFADKLVIKENLSFPVSKLIYEIITSQSQDKQAKQMLFGFSLSWIFCFLRDGFLKFAGFLPKIFFVFPSIFKQNFGISIMPMLWSIGFISGVDIVLPLLFGLASKYLVIAPLNYYFNNFSQDIFVMAFASGLVLSELLLGLTKYPQIIFKKIKLFKFNNLKNNIKINSNFSFKSIFNFELFFSLILSFIFLTYFKFSFLSQLLLLLFIVLATYQVSYLGGKIGLITFGRFATFIMIPMMLLFKLNFLQITLLVVFFNICAGVASDLLFDYKVGQLCDIEFKKIYKAQWVGLFFTAITIGFFVWLLFNTFQLGSPELFAQRGKSRALLLQSLNFDWRILLLGFVYGVILKKFKVSPTMVFGGILMPNNLTIGLSIGALVSYFSKKGESKFSLWSGVFAGESIWILFSILMRVLVK